MQINTMARYGMRAVIRLAILTEGKHTLASIKTIAGAENISPKYLESIFAILRKHNILASVKGKGGGYRLTRPLKQITSLEIIEILGGKIGPVDCVSDKNACGNNPENCTVSLLWCDMNTLIRDYLKSRTLENLLLIYRKRTKTGQKK